MHGTNWKETKMVQHIQRARRAACQNRTERNVSGARTLFWRQNIEEERERETVCVFRAFTNIRSDGEAASLWNSCLVFRLYAHSRTTHERGECSASITAKQRQSHLSHTSDRRAAEWDGQCGECECMRSNWKTNSQRWSKMMIYHITKLIHWTIESHESELNDNLTHTQYAQHSEYLLFNWNFHCFELRISRLAWLTREISLVPFSICSRFCWWIVATHVDVNS